MAALRSQLSPLPLRAYNAAQGAIHRAANPKQAEAPTDSQTDAAQRPQVASAAAAAAIRPPPGSAPTPQAPVRPAVRTAIPAAKISDVPAFTLQTLSTFAGLIIGTQPGEATAGPTPPPPISPSVGSPTAANVRPLPPGSSLDLKV